ncbi:hypothetical protein KSF_091940 [Reticulibacter mediterranei]|uniref:CBM6 domain-containing protein n=1 Tax=Reticulibacter mediterranei TaxID=2778369 RepID=A0A8J3IQZ8_9CHLR|nr:CBM35 domain-containing protein [Reticulibacter mediterranei]GHO99146.1 hypothetical protein KSF_091940 [Reticulibacter mediterranei]
MHLSFRSVSLRIGLVLTTSVLAAIAFFAIPSTTTRAAAIDQLVGYGAGTTGGAGGSSVTVSSLSALTSAVSGSSAKIVNISGTISGDTDVKVGSNTTILGVGSTGALVGIGLDLDGVSNVIIRNLSISKVLASDTNGDAIHIINGTTKVWVDHNNLFSDRDHDKDYYDGLLDITHAGDNITVSWNRFHDHWKVSLVGHSDSNGSEDTGHLHVTYHHNWFYSVNSRTPSLRFGTGHVYNNYFQNVDDSAIHSRMGAQMLIENNVFSGVSTPITTTGDSSQDGYANATGNDYGGGTPDITQVGSFTKAPYSYTLDATSSVVSSVTANSGVGIVTGGGGSNPTPTPTSSNPTPTPTSGGSTPTPTPTTPTGGSTYQAENGTLSNATVQTSAGGYTGTGYVVFNSVGGYIQWTVNIASAGKYNLTFGYSNSASNSQPCAISVNGSTVKDNMTFKSTGSNSTWSTATTSQTLAAGNNTLRITANASGGPNIDYVQITAA